MWSRRHIARLFAFLTVVGVWALAAAWGTFAVAGAVEFVRAGRVESIAALAGAASIALGVVLAVLPLACRIVDAVRDDCRAGLLRPARRSPPRTEGTALSGRRSHG